MRALGWAALGGIALAAGIGAGVAFAERGPDGYRQERGSHGHGHWRGHGKGDGEGRHGRWLGRGDGGERTRDDALGNARARFAEFDVNSDGVIDRDELKARFSSRADGRRGDGRLQQRLQRMFSRIDADRDGKATREEFAKSIEERFARADINGDGQITDDDLPPFMRGRGALEADGPAAGGRQGGPRGHGGRGRGMGMMQTLRDADANGDGVITRDEMAAASAKRFERFDRNSDGAVDSADAETFRDEMVDYRVARFLARFGAQASGQISRDEFLAKAEERFAERDLNSDGRITGDERRGGRGHWRRGQERDDGGPRWRERRGDDGAPGDGGDPPVERRL